MSIHTLRSSFVILLLLSALKSMAQIRDTSAFSQPVMIDEVIIRAGDFDAAEFINRIRQDTTFYKAFKTLRLVSFNADNNIKVLEKKGSRVKASLISETKQIYRDRCRTMNVLEEKTTGDFYDRKGNYNYYTAELYASLFFTKGKVCNENNIVKGYTGYETKGKSTLEKSKTKLKQLMFNPGSKVSGVPFMGDKSAIFEPHIARMYDFSIKAEEKNGVSCLMFEARPKPEYADKVVINLFKTWFRQSDYSIVARDYALSYKTGVYDFNVVMHVDLQQIGKHLLPTFISYSGNWYAMTKGRERVTFTTRFYY